MEIFKVKAFARFCRGEAIADAALADAIHRANAGLVDADLGGGVIKQRVARSGQGKSGGYRTIILFRLGKRAIFAFGFAKKDQENVDREEVAAFRKAASLFLNFDAGDVARMIESGAWIEVNDDDETV